MSSIVIASIQGVLGLFWSEDQACKSTFVLACLRVLPNAMHAYIFTILLAFTVLES